MASRVQTKVPGIVVRVEDLIEEADCMLSLCYPFVDLATYQSLRTYRSHVAALSSCKANAEKIITLRPIRTGLADVRKRNIYAEISGNWAVTPLSNRSNKAPFRRNVAFSGIASTRIELFEKDSAERVAMWRIELGIYGAPGSYFHMQVLGDTTQRPFPKTIEIPRFPSFFATPMSAIDYTLGELFGSEWEKSTSGKDRSNQKWCQLQKRFLGRQLDWYRNILSSPSPSNWMSIKTAVPPSDLFL